MPALSSVEWAALAAALAAVAFVYASVGHGGASGYLAVLSLASIPIGAARPGALALNVLVSGTALAQFSAAGHFSWRLFLPFAAASVPAAFAGGSLRASEGLYAGVLAFALVAAAGRLLLPLAARAPGETRPPPLPPALAAGAAIGFASGLVGVGGGIFLSPLLLLAGWADAKRTAAVSAAFIFVNSAAGLAGHAAAGGALPFAAWPLVLAPFAAGLAGARLGARQIPNPWLCRLLALVLLAASFHLARKALGG